MTLKEIIKDKTNILENAEKTLYDGIEAAEKNIFSKVLGILRGLAQKEGRLKKDTVNNSLLKSLSVKVLEAIRKSTLEKKINAFLPNFETIEKLNNELYTNLADKKFTQKVKTEIGTYRKLLISGVVDGILGEANIESNFGEPIKRILFNGIATRQKTSDIENQLRLFIKGDSTRKGNVSRYVRQLTMDALNQHDGYINDLARDTYQLDGWIYVGSIVDNTRSNCKDLVNSTNKLSSFAIRKGVYRTDDIQAIIDVLRKGKGSGWNPATTKETFAQYRGGFNCRHQLAYIPLSAEDKQKEILES